MDSRSVGVEEEFLLVEPETGRPKAVAGTVLQESGPESGKDLEGELQRPPQPRGRPNHHGHPPRNRHRFTH